MYDVAFIEQLQTYIFKKTGKTYFKNIRDGREDILVTCPIHKEGQERHPSCGFSKVDKENINAGVFHCFNCGFTGDTHTVLKELLGNMYDKEEANNALGLDDYEFERTLNNTLPLFTLPPLQENKYVSRAELKQYDFYSDYVRSRGIPDNIADIYRIGYDTRTAEVTFPIRDKTGGTLAVGRRSVLNKRYEYPLGFTKPLYGVYELPTILSNIEVWVVEGPFNLWSLRNYKEYGVALLGTGTRTQLEQLLTIDCKGFILALDGDAAGRKGNIKIANFLLKHRRKVKVACVPDNEDINSMEDWMFHQMYRWDFRKWHNMIKSRFGNENNQEEAEEFID